MARLRLCAVVLAALLLAAAHAERIEDASEEDDAGLGYIVTLNDDDADAEDLCAALAADTDDFTGGAAALDFTAEFPLLRRYEQVACARRVQGICRRVFRRGALGINGMVVDALSRGRIRALARCLPNAVVEPDLPVTAQALDSGNPNQYTPWNLDRLDQAFLPLDGVAGLYTAANGGGDGVHAYVIDSGVRATHREFTVQSSDPNDIKFGWDKTSRVERGVDLVVGSNSRPDLSLANRDCDGHGTHIAATLAGTHVGVAPLATVHPARVLDCRGDGRASDVVAALDWCVSFYFRTGNSTDDDDVLFNTYRCAGHIVYNRVAKGGRDGADASTHPAVATLALGLMAGARSIAMERAVAQFTRRTGALVVVSLFLVIFGYFWLFLVIFGNIRKGN